VASNHHLWRATNPLFALFSCSVKRSLTLLISPFFLSFRLGGGCHPACVSVLCVFRHSPRSSCSPATHPFPWRPHLDLSIFPFVSLLHLLLHRAVIHQSRVEPLLLHVFFVEIGLAVSQLPFLPSLRPSLLLYLLFLFCFFLSLD